MKNELGMKPGETRKRFADEFHTLGDLELAIEKAAMISNQDTDLINVEGRFELEAECLSDGSIVYNVGIVGNVMTTWQG